MMSTVFLFLEMITCISMLYNLFSFELTHSRKRLFCFTVLFILGITYYIYSDIYQIIPVPQTLIISVLCIFLFEYKIFPLITAFWLISLFSLLVPDTVIYTYHIITATNLVSFSTLENICSIICYILYIILSFVTKERISSYFQIFKEFTLKQTIVVFLITIFDFFIFTMSGLLLRPVGLTSRSGRILLVYCIFAVVILSIFILFLYFYVKKYNTVLLENNKINRELLELEKKHYIEIRQKNDDLRAFRHDYNYHIAALHSLAQSNDLAALQDYILNLSDIKEELSYIHTNNIVADSIINYFYEIYSKRISFHIEGKFPDHLFIENNDLCTILSNIMKNAVEAATQTAPASISLSVIANDEYAAFSLENTCQGYENSELKKLKTTKMDTRNHGLGLKNVAKVVDIYEGSLEIDCVDHIFYTKIYLHNADQIN